MRGYSSNRADRDSRRLQAAAQARRQPAGPRRVSVDAEGVGHDRHGRAVDADDNALGHHAQGTVDDQGRVGDDRLSAPRGASLPSR